MQYHQNEIVLSCKLNLSPPLNCLPADNHVHFTVLSLMVHNVESQKGKERIRVERKEGI
jgi:hypothetical protein